MEGFSVAYIVDNDDSVGSPVIAVERENNCISFPGDDKRVYTYVEVIVLKRSWPAVSQI